MVLHDCTSLVRVLTIRRNYVNTVKKYVRSCPECQQVKLKESHYVDLHLPIQLFLSMDILGQYCETENGNQYALSCAC